MGTRLVAVDIGSMRPPSRFAWAAFDAPGRDVAGEGTDPQSAISALVPGLLTGCPGGAPAGSADCGADPGRAARA
jgi:hypothetical protein